MFATHYHELNEMEKSFGRVKNFNVSVKDVGNKVIFLRKLVSGGSNHSFGIHVARMAGMPPSVVRREPTKFCFNWKIRTEKKAFRSLWKAWPRKEKVSR